MGGASTSPTARPGDHEVGKRHPECFRDPSERGELRQEPAAFDAVHGGARDACASGESALRQASDAANLSDLPADRCRRGNFACADLVGEVRIAFGPNEVPRQLDLVLAAGDRYLERHAVGRDGRPRDLKIPGSAEPSEREPEPIPVCERDTHGGRFEDRLDHPAVSVGGDDGRECAHHRSGW